MNELPCWQTIIVKNFSADLGALFNCLFLFAALKFLFLSPDIPFLSSLFLLSSHSLCILLLSHRSSSFLSLIIYGRSSMVWRKEQRCGICDIWAQDRDLPPATSGTLGKSLLGFISLSIRMEAHAEHPGYNRLLMTFGFLLLPCPSCLVHPETDWFPCSPILSMSLSHSSSYVTAQLGCQGPSPPFGPLPFSFVTNFITLSRT